MNPLPNLPSLPLPLPPPRQAAAAGGLPDHRLRPRLPRRGRLHVPHGVHQHGVALHHLRQHILSGKSATVVYSNAL